MSNFDDFLKEQLKSEEFRREYEALEPDYELVLRGDVDPRNLCYPIKMDGTEYSDYERGYNDGVIAAYWLTRQARKIEAEPVVSCQNCGWWHRNKSGDLSRGVCDKYACSKSENGYCDEPLLEERKYPWKN